jgi:hypothetical protein
MSSDRINQKILQWQDDFAEAGFEITQHQQYLEASLK